jgi:serine/threonine protein kinase
MTDELVALARQVGDPTRAPRDRGLQATLDRLYLTSCNPEQFPEPADLYFLGPPVREGELGTLGEYEVQEVIGQGGMGLVLKAFEPALGRLVAVKVLSPALAGSATARRRFAREGRAAAAVCHEHIVAVYSVRETDRLPYLVMQYVAGESLQARLQRTGPLEVLEVVRIGLQTAQGLAAAHAQGLIHRDIKPANLLLEGIFTAEDAENAERRPEEEQGFPSSSALSALSAVKPLRVKITDFGLARMADDIGLTQVGVVAGTPEYMAPEQARGESIDHRADLFSLGSVLYALCTGLPPFQGTTAVAVLRQVSDQAATPIRSLNPNIPTWLEEFVNRLMEKNPADRIQSASEAAVLLEGYLASLSQSTTGGVVPLPLLPANRAEPVLVRPPRGSFRGVRGALWLVVLLAALGLGVPLLMQMLQAQPSQTLDFYQDFRGIDDLPAPFELRHADGALVRFEKEGLRLTVPRSRKKNGVSVFLPLNLEGDFEITAGYELLPCDPPQGGHGVGFHLEYTTTLKRKAHVSVDRLTRINEGDVVWCARQEADEDGQDHYDQHHEETTARAGQLRLTRSGDTVSYWAAEDPKGEFHKLFEHSVDRENVNAVKLMAYQGWECNPVDLRIRDLRVRSLNAVEAKSALADSEHVSSQPWLLLGLLSLGLVPLLLLGLWLYARRREQPAESAPAAGQLPVAFECQGCGKKLRANSALAGKRVKCPQCSQAVLVPTTEP